MVYRGQRGIGLIPGLIDVLIYITSFFCVFTPCFYPVFTPTLGMNSVPSHEPRCMHDL